MNSEKSHYVIVTGADGYVGKMICLQLLERTTHDLIMWVRADSAEEFNQKNAQLQDAFSQWLPRITLVYGNLVNTDPFSSVANLNIDLNHVHSIFHSAAVTAFNVDSDSADAVNREGTRKLLDFARNCPKLQTLGYVSTLYASGMAAGSILESPSPADTSFANHYERSKNQAEQLLFTEYSDLPWQIYRIATVLSHDDNGAVTQFNVFHNTLRLLFYGLISMLPGEETTPVHFVTGEFVADSIAQIAQTGSTQQIFHVCHSTESALTIAEFVDICFAEFAQDTNFTKRRILRPLFTELEAFQTLADGLSGLSGQVVSQAVDSIKPFAPQLFIHKNFTNNQLLNTLQEDYQQPNSADQLRNTVRYLIETQWGKAT